MTVARVGYPRRGMYLSCDQARELEEICSVSSHNDDKQLLSGDPDNPAGGETVVILGGMKRVKRDPER